MVPLPVHVEVANPIADLSLLGERGLRINEQGRHLGLLTLGLRELACLLSQIGETLREMNGTG